MSREVTITFNGISSPILKAITSFKLQKRNMKGLTESEKQKVVEELDDLFIVMISDTKLNKGKPLWDFINLREAYIYDNNKNADESTICDFRYSLYTRMLENDLPLETALYCLYGCYCSDDYVEEFNIEYVDNILDTIIDKGYVHKNVKKLDERSRRLFLWLVCTVIEKKKVTLDQSLIYAVAICFIYLSVRGYGQKQCFESLNYFSSKTKIPVMETFTMCSIMEWLFSAYNSDVYLRNYARFFMSENKESVSASTLMNFIKIIMRSKKGIDLYNDNFVTLTDIVFDEDKYENGNEIVEYKFEDEKYREQIKNEIISLLKKSDLNKLCKRDADVSYFEVLRKAFGDDNLIKERIMELKLSNKGE